MRSGSPRGNHQRFFSRYPHLTTVRHLKVWQFLLIVSLPLLACQTVRGVLAPAATAVPTVVPTDTVSPTEISVPTVEDDFPPLSQDEQQGIFDELWGIVDEEYLYEDFNGVDWEQTYTQFDQKIEKGMSTADFYLAMDEMLYSLGDDHSVYLDPQQAAEEEETYNAESDYVGIGVWLGANLETERAVVYVVFPGSPADQAGIRMHDSILEADGQPILDEDGGISETLLGLAGAPVSVTVQTPGQEPRRLELNRAHITSAIPIVSHEYTSPAGQRIGYIMIPSFADGSIDEQVQYALEEMGQPEPLDGLILDNRINEGGYDDVASNTLRYFVNGVLGHFVNRRDKEAFQVRQRDVYGSSTVPLVVLVGIETHSFGEIFSGIMADQQRATLIGETTEGNLETMWQYAFWDGSVAWIAHDTFQPVNQPDADWERTGIVPDLVVPSQWDQITLDNDPAVAAALAFFDGK